MRRTGERKFFKKILPTRKQKEETQCSTSSALSGSGSPLLLQGAERTLRRAGGRFFRCGLRLAAPAERYTGLVSVAGLRDRLRRLNTAFERIAADPRALAHALVYSYVGWVFFTLPLVAAAEAVGLTVAPLLVLFVVPASTLAGLVPSPGGLGGVEVALSALLVALVGMAGHNAVAVTLLYRVESYWFALVVGGAAALYVIYRN